jgi:cytoskeletal protein CcmA (bactofilin family)
LIASGLTISGDLTSEEDLALEGLVVGSVVVSNNRVFVRSSGCVNGHVIGSTIIVAGRVNGNLYAEKKVVVRSSANVRGKIFAPRVALEAGGRFKGRVNMDSKSRTLAAARTRILKRHLETP